MSCVTYQTDSRLQFKQMTLPRHKCESIRKRYNSNRTARLIDYSRPTLMVNKSRLSYAMPERLFDVPVAGIYTASGRLFISSGPYREIGPTRELVPSLSGSTTSLQQDFATARSCWRSYGPINNFSEKIQLDRSRQRTVDRKTSDVLPHVWKMFCDLDL